MGRTRKLEPADDASDTSDAFDFFDLSNADPTDSEILDEQAVLDILESAPYAPPDPSAGDDRDDTDKSVPDGDLTNTFSLLDNTIPRSKYVGDNDPTRTTEVREVRAIIERVTEGITGRQRNQPKAARVSSVRRLLNWFMSRFGAV